MAIKTTATAVAATAQRRDDARCVRRADFLVAMLTSLARRARVVGTPRAARARAALAPAQGSKSGEKNGRHVFHALRKIPHL